MESHEFYMGDVCDRLAELGHAAYVEHSGGGCATIYAGDPVTRTERSTVQMGPGAPVEVREYESTTFPVLGGPGVFDWTDPDKSRGSVHEFYVGPGHDDEGTHYAMPTDAPDPVGWAVAMIHRLLTDATG